MRRLSLIALCSLLLLGAAGLEFEGQGEVPVVGGNLVSARRLALRNARRDAVSRAVATLVAADQVSANEARLRQTIYLRASRYVRTYRVLEEVQEGQNFSLRLAAALDLKKLQGDLGKLLGTRFPTPRPARGALLGLALRLPDEPVLAAAMKRRLRLALGRVGVASVSLEGAGARRPGLVLVLRGRLRCEQAREVRGAGWPGAAASATLRLEPASGGGSVASGSARAWGAGASAAAARESAAGQALDRALAPLLAHLRGRPDLRRPDSGKSGWTVRLTGVTAHGQYAAVTRALQRSIPGVRSCKVRQVARGEVSYRLQTSARPRQLAAALEQHAFSGFSLKLKSISGGSVWMTIAAAPEGEG